MPEATLQTEWLGQFGRGLWRYIRSSFNFAGQNSFTDPPTQNEDQFEQLLNVMPPVQGDLDRRWGYKLFRNGAYGADSSQQPYAMSLWASDPPNLRYLVTNTFSGVTQRQTILSEDGATEIANLVFAGPPRSETSRGFLYTYDGVKPKKWQLSFGNTTENVGIDVNDIVPLAVGQNAPTTAVNTGTGSNWISPTSVFVQNNVEATVTLNNGFAGTISIGGFNFALPTNAQIVGVLIEIAGHQTPAPLDATANIFASIGDGVSINLGAAKQITLPKNGISAGGFFGGPQDLWGVGFLTPTTVNANNFRVNIYAAAVGPTPVTFFLDFVGVTFYLKQVPPTVTIVGGGGNIILVSGRIYSIVYYNPTTQSYSDLSAFTNSTGPVNAPQQVQLSNIQPHNDPQVTRFKILATGDGGDTSTWYELVDLPSGTVGYVDNIAEADLLLRNQWQALLSDGTEVGLADNTPPPPQAQYPKLHRGRMYLLSGSNLFYSKSEDELLTPTGVVAGNFEECWPALNFFPVANSGEQGRGLLSDGTVLYIGTDRRIVRLFGDGPDTFLQPQVLFDNVGTVNQDVWKLIFIQGNPVGAMWLTPDNRVVGSDFNTYQDIGTPVQNVLDTINMSAIQTAWASYVGISIQNLYVLAVPTGTNTQPDTLLVFDIKGKQWFEWQCADTLVSGFWWVTLGGEPQFVVQAATGKFYVFDPSLFQDRVGDTPVSFTSTMRTSWLALGDPTARKFLNEVEIMTGDPLMTVTVEGASTVTEFTTPNQVVFNRTITQKPLGEYAVFLAGSSTKDRFYRFTFNSSDTATDLMRTYSIQGKVLHRV